MTTTFRKNLIGEANGSFESGTIGTWVDGQAEVSLTASQTEAYLGKWSLRIERTGTSGVVNDMWSHAGGASDFRPGVVPGQFIFLAAQARPAGSAGTVTVTPKLQWYNAAGALLSTTTAAGVSCPADKWTLVITFAFVPANARSVRIGFNTTSIDPGEFVYLDEVTLWREPPLWKPTTEQILNLDGVRQRTDAFRFELNSRDLRPIGDLHPDLSSAPTISSEVTANGGSRRLGTLKLTPDEMTDVNPLTDRLRVYHRLQNGAEYLLGTFLWADASTPKRSWGDEQHSELVDYSFILDQQSTRAFGFGRGAHAGLIMIFLSGQAGFELADIAVIGPEADRTLSEPLAWQPGTTWRQMLNDVCAAVGFAGPWFDRDGRLHFDQPRNPAFDPPTVPSYDSFPRVLRDSIVHSNDLLSAPNDFAVFDSGTDLLRAGRFTLPPEAPHSFPNRGFHVGLAESRQGIATQDQADMAAESLARTRADAFEWLDFTSTADPRHDMWDIVPILGKLWLETKHSLVCVSGGKHAHTLKRTTYDF